MNLQKDKPKSRASKSILVMSDDGVFDQFMANMVPKWPDVTMSTELSSFQEMNGKAADLAFAHDVVIFVADPGNGKELDAVAQLLANREPGTAFIALAEDNMSIANARRLTEMGVDEVLPISITEENLRAVIDRTLDARDAAASAHALPKPAHAELIAVTQARGGIGATTIAVNLACSLAASGGAFLNKQTPKRVALLDFDLQFGNANVFLDLEDKGGFLELLDGRVAPTRERIAQAMQPHETGIDILCAPASVAPLQMVSSDTVASIIDILQQEYDYIVVDMPRALIDWIEPVIAAAARLMIVTDTSVPSFRHTRRLIDFYREDRTDLPVEVVVNHEKRPMFKSKHIRAAEEMLETKLAFWLPDNPRVARKSVDLGRPIVKDMLGSDLGKALSRISKVVATDPRHAKPEIV